MSLSPTTIKGIKSIIQKFIDENGFVKSEDDAQVSYTIEILKLLGWDSSKWKINTPQEVKTGNKPDILLKGSGGGTIFVIESKAPNKSLDDRYINKTFKEQICEYCNSEGVYWGVLTNFIEWRIYNSYTKELYYNDKYFTIIDKKLNDDTRLFDFFEKLTYSNLNTTKGKIDSNPVYYKKQEEIKDEFFSNLKLWRHKLRNYLSYELKTKTTEPDKEAVERLTQKILDRLIFMEVCNDKNIISHDILGSILYTKRNKYEELKVKFRELDEKFNSDLFAEDVYCDMIKINDDPMEEIIRGINNIDFSKLSVHIIGEVYENYLGELLRKGKKEIKVVESKERAKRKSQGIYYTPDYIVNYIVENTLGELLKNCKTADEIQKIRVLDPACGSGSFLIRAFDEFYMAYKNCAKTMELFDDFEIKKKILLYNLYGVDLDERAVDIAKLNLLIKALEGSTESSLIGRKLLPNLNLNIRCGNSLVSGKSLHDLTDGTLFDNTEQFKKDIDILIALKEKFKHAVEDEEKEKLLDEVYVYEEKINSYLNNDLKNYFKNLDEVKPFNYEVAFCEIFKYGGFDCVIGNPPWVDIKGLNPKDVKYYFDTFDTVKNRMNIYAVFMNVVLNLIKDKGYFSFITPNSYLTQSSYVDIRKFIFSCFNFRKIVRLPDNVFKDVKAESVISVINKERSSKSHKVEVYIYDRKKEINKIEKENTTFYGNINQAFWKFNNDYVINLFLTTESQDILTKISNNGRRLEDYCDFSLGLTPYDRYKGHTKQQIESRVFHSNKMKNKTFKPLLTGENITRYRVKWDGKEWISYGGWLGAPRQKRFFTNERILVRQIVSGQPLRIYSAYTNKEYYNAQIAFNLVSNSKNKLSLKYIIGILNSNLMNYYHRNKYLDQTKELFQKILIENAKEFPIRDIDFKNKQDKSLHDKLIKLVDEMLKLNKAPEKNKIKIKAKDKEIDELVYKLYGLTEEEIGIVEG